MSEPERKPRFGRTRDGQAVHMHVVDHLPAGNPVTRFNKWLAVQVSRGVGTMWCAYIFAGIALYGLPAALKPGGEGLISWIAQTFLQLVLLSVIIVGQNIQSQASDARAAKTFEDVESVKNDIGTALDRLDIKTQGGLKDILDAVHGVVLQASQEKRAQ